MTMPSKGRAPAGRPEGTWNWTPDLAELFPARFNALSGLTARYAAREVLGRGTFGQQWTYPFRAEGLEGAWMCRWDAELDALLERSGLSRGLHRVLEDSRLHWAAGLRLSAGLRVSWPHPRASSGACCPPTGAETASAAFFVESFIVEVSYWSRAR